VKLSQENKTKQNKQNQKSHQLQTFAVLSKNRGEETILYLLCRWEYVSPSFLTTPCSVQHTRKYSELNGRELRRTALSSEATAWWLWQQHWSTECPYIICFSSIIHEKQRKEQPKEVSV